jgi:UDP-N-acetylmuramoyl-L-alanyl-D-glutamate--2,6-diaminopimelate ligase
MGQLMKELIYRLKRPFHLVKTGLLRGLIGELQYGFPARRLKILAVTGTDGKTTSATLTYHVLQAAGYKVALLSTVGAFIGEEAIDTGFHVTSPDPKQVHQFFKRVLDAGFEYVVLEVTSHGAYQFRDWGINPLVAGVTNIDREHLDYHLNYQNYVEAKSFFLRKAKRIFLNEDDESYSKLKKLLKKNTLSTYSANDPLPPVVSSAIKARFPEKYNQMNARLVYSLTSFLNIKKTVFAEAIRTFPGVMGRMEWIPTRKKFRVVVDFAHTPQALEAALTSLRAQLKAQNKPGRLIAVFGAAGLRDRTKRPIMGAIGAKLADFAILTAEDPRTEDVWSIIRQMKEQLTENHSKVLSIADRKDAIFFAIQELAQSGDIIGIFGKGHEKSMCFGTTEYPWSDQETVKEALGE